MEAVFKREFRSYFTGMTGWIFFAVLFIFCGIFTTAINLLGHAASFEYVLSNMTIVLLFLMPVLAMRSLAEEKRSRTDGLLYSLPVGMRDVVAGKYLALVSVWGIACLAIGAVPLILSFYGKIYFASAYGTLLGFFLLGCALLAICMFFSSLMENQILVAVSGFGSLLLLYLMKGIASLIPAGAGTSLLAFIAVEAVAAVILYLLTKNIWTSVGAFALFAIPTVTVYLVKKSLFEGLFPKLLGYTAVFDRFDSFVNGIFDITAIVYYITLAFFFVWLSVQSMDRKRWN
ncbi:MAG: ABC-2 transporter permease [Clostridia bacterium]|nr:ABC-2 transporter permease [Clostridia bacterium]